MRILAFSLLGGIVVVLVQSTLFHLLPLGGLLPDLMVIFCVYLGLYQHTVGGVSGAFFLGYLLDSVSGSPVGMYAFTMTLIFAATFLISRMLWVDHLWANMTVVFLAAIMKAATVLCLFFLYLSVEGMGMGAVGVGLGEAILAALFSPLIFGILHRGRRFVEGEG